MTAGQGSSLGSGNVLGTPRVVATDSSARQVRLGFGAAGKRVLVSVCLVLGSSVRSMARLVRRPSGGAAAAPGAGLLAVGRERGTGAQWSRWGARRARRRGYHFWVRLHVHFPCPTLLLKKGCVFRVCPSSPVPGLREKRKGRCLRVPVV